MSIWGVRLWLGVLLLFGYEMLVWVNPFSLSPLDWAFRGAVCTLLATLLLDLAVRFRVRDIYDSMALVAIIALLAGLLINPALAYEEFPRTLLTRVLGAYALVGIEMLGLMLVLCRIPDARTRRLILPVAAWTGFYIGVWLRWTPVFTARAPDVSLMGALALIGGLFAICALGWMILRPTLRTTTPKALKLSPVQFLLLVALLIALLLPHLATGSLPTGALVASLILIGIAYLILWFRRSERDPMLLEAFLPSQPPSPLWLAGMAGVFVAACLFAYSLPLVGTREINQLWLMELGFGLVGATWFPLVAAVLAFRAVDVQMRRSEL